MSATKLPRALIAVSAALLMTACGSSDDDLTETTEYVMSKSELQDAGLAATDNLRENRQREDQWRGLGQAEKEFEQRRQEMRAKHGRPTS